VIAARRDLLIRFGPFLASKALDLERFFTITRARVRT
jgi:hypothetical protein